MNYQNLPVWANLSRAIRVRSGRQDLHSRRWFLKSLAALAAMCRTGLARDSINRSNEKTVFIDGGGDSRLFTAEHLPPFEETVLQMVGADSNGQLLPGFDQAAIAKTLALALGESVFPDRVLGLENIPSCGLYPLTIIEPQRIRRFRFWVLMEE